VNIQRSLHQSNALLHTDQAEAVTPLLRIEAGTMVRYRQHDRPLALTELYGGRIAPGMTHNVVQGLLGDAIKA